MCSYLPICFSKSPRRFLFIYFLSCVFHSNAPFRPQLAASGVGQPASVWKWRNWEVRDHSVGHRDCTGCRWWGNRKPTSARHRCTTSLLFMHWLQHCFRSHFVFIFWFEEKCLNQNTKLFEIPWLTLIICMLIHHQDRGDGAHSYILYGGNSAVITTT